MTPKILARPSEVRRYATWAPHLLAADGRRFVWGHRVPHFVRELAVGDKVWVAHRLNVPTSEWCFELYQVTIVEDKWMAEHGHPNYPKKHFGNGRYIVFEV